MNKNFIGFLLSIFFLNSCISVISPQTADTLAPGEMSAYVALTTPVMYYANKSDSSDTSDGGSDSEDEDSDSSGGETMDALWFDVGTRYGLSDNLDFGVEKTGMITHFDFKRRLFGSGKGASMAIGAGLGSNNLSGFLNSSKSSFFIRTSDIPLYFSTRIGETSSFYSVLRYHYTHVESKSSLDLSGSTDSTTDTETDNAQKSISARNVALSLGGVFGEPVGFFIEIAAIKGMDKEGNNDTRPQIALGFTLRNSVPKSTTDTETIVPVTTPKTSKKPKTLRH
jgi:hypothetical protein